MIDMTNIINFVKDHLILIIIIGSIIIIFLYVMYAVFLNKLNQAIYGKNTWMAWIPIFNTYLLGKLTINKLFGWILVLASFAGGGYVTTTNGFTEYHSLLPTEFQEPYTIIYVAVIVILYIYAHFKLNAIIRTKGEVSDLDSLSINNYSNLNRPFVTKENVSNNYSNGVYNQLGNANLTKTETTSNPVDNGINENNQGIVNHVRLSDIRNLSNDQINDYNDAISSNNDQNSQQ